MVKRTCPSCGEPVYSAADQEPVWLCPHCGKEVPRKSEISMNYYQKSPRGLVLKPAEKPKVTNYDRIRNMSIEEMAVMIMCPNELGMAEIECDKSGDKNCCWCCLDWLKRETCR